MRRRVSFALALVLLALMVCRSSSLAQYKPPNAQNQKKARKQKPYIRHISRNKQVNRYYDILDTYQAGISLFGSEVKSARLGTVSLQSSYIKVSGSSCFLVNSRFSEYANSFNGGHEPIRDRRLLLHKREALKIAQQIDQKGLTCVPLKIYFNEDGKIKIDIGIGRGKDNRDRRQDIKDREGKRTVARQLKNFNFG
ncbi:hypothetical protein TrVE_jg14301 [Triparma verrucosa]|uniref:SsrA-binding protein n=2 Tax=Triparma TaxID=722752 RepID=A0A9W7DVS2_9STRA|nr:hypothetical protein TrST_g4528 [Triparma strigata]GMI00059.1 hypothetical protein TrVE_jg14301 [Triparma verrucosa]